MIQLLDVQQETGPLMADSLTALYPSRYRRVLIERGNYTAIARNDTEGEERVSIITGAGSGNDPWPLGYVGSGLADGAVAGPRYTAPSARAILALTREVPHAKGVVYVCTNHAGDVLNFELASELAGLEGIRTATIAVADDAASASREEHSLRRGRAGVLLALKAAAGAAALGMRFEDVLRIAGKANENVSTLSVYYASVVNPRTKEMVLKVPDGMVNYGAGFNGEMGLFQRPFRGLDDTVDTMMDFLIADLQPLPSVQTAALVNGAGRTGPAQMLAIMKRVQQNLRKNEVKIYGIWMEQCFSPADIDGFSISLMNMDEELAQCLKEKAWTPFIHSFM